MASEKKRKKLKSHYVCHFCGFSYIGSLKQHAKEMHGLDPKPKEECKHKWKFMERGPNEKYESVWIFHCVKCLEIKEKSTWE